MVETLQGFFIRKFCLLFTRVFCRREIGLTGEVQQNRSALSFYRVHIAAYIGFVQKKLAHHQAMQSVEPLIVPVMHTPVGGVD